MGEDVDVDDLEEAPKARSAAPRRAGFCVVKAKAQERRTGLQKETPRSLATLASVAASLILRTRRLTRKTRREGEVSIVPSRPPGGYVGDQEPHGLHQDYSPRGRLATAGAAVLAPITFVTNGLSGFLASRLGPERQERCTARYPAVVNLFWRDAAWLSRRQRFQAPHVRRALLELCFSCDADARVVFRLREEGSDCCLYMAFIKGLRILQKSREGFDFKPCPFVAAGPAATLP